MMAPVRHRGPAWSEAEEDTLIANQTLSLAALGAMLGRSRSAINNRRTILIKQGRLRPQRWDFTEEEDARIIDLLPTQSVQEIARRIGRTPNTVGVRRARLIAEGRISRSPNRKSDVTLDTTDRDNAIGRAYLGGETIASIAGRFDLSNQGVYGVLKRTGVTPNRNRRKAT